VLSALFWGGLYRYFSSADAHRHSWWLRWGPVSKAVAPPNPTDKHAPPK
jgi:hypothetical protein